MVRPVAGADGRCGVLGVGQYLEQDEVGGEHLIERYPVLDSVLG